MQEDLIKCGLHRGENFKIYSDKKLWNFLDFRYETWIKQFFNENQIRFKK